ncbi:hypothetical protein BVC80_1827g65 [Macleaya cordata]|uniref:Retrotransposon Copia-like N-terminal domain-containing protein n=1 Tax=Macleaya cordata TaxID=56857 RepID=A0A200QBA9_MACCD|nr:hypothetical protein BVC80_1827g65 [Macleaya cordata]
MGLVVDSFIMTWEGSREVHDTNRFLVESSFLKLIMASPSWNINNLVTVRLTEENYLLWRSQIFPALRGYNLLGFVDETRICPPEFIEIDGKLQENEKFDDWIRQDQMILSWINSTLSEGILAQVVGLSTASEVWKRSDSSILSTAFYTPRGAFHNNRGRGRFTNNRGRGRGRSPNNNSSNFYNQNRNNSSQSTSNNENSSQQTLFNRPFNPIQGESSS